MAWTWGPFWGLLLLGAAIKALAEVGSHKGSSSHSLQYFDISVSEPVQGLPHFIEVGYVDGQPFVRYDSNTKKMLPQVSWIKEVDKEDPQYWDRNTQNAQATELVFRENMKTAMNQYNQTGGLHTWQKMYGCEWRDRESTGGYYVQYGYDGRDFLAFDKETLSWRAGNGQGQLSKRKWDADLAWSQYQKSYLEEDCIKWLKKHLRYGEKILMRKEPPKVKVTSRADYDNMETLICRADGFYPKDISAVWTRDGEVWEQETLRGLVAPNSDRTYHIWISTKVDPKDKNSFRCRVDHASWKDPVDFAVEEPASVFNLWLIIGCTILGVFLLVAGIIGILLFQKKQQDGYRAAPSVVINLETH